jgi:hypothetical protein
MANMATVRADIVRNLVSAVGTDESRDALLGGVLR